MLRTPPLHSANPIYSAGAYIIAPAGKINIFQDKKQIGNSVHTLYCTNNAKKKH